jgi:hypothetical protein
MIMTIVRRGKYIGGTDTTHPDRDGKDEGNRRGDD